MLKQHKRLKQTSRRNQESNGGVAGEEIYKSLAKTIRDLRTSYRGKGISQTELAREINANPNTVSRWESGIYKPSIAELIALSRFFGVPLSGLLSEPEEPPYLISLLGALNGLEDADVKDVISYALYRRTLASARTGT